MFSLGRALLCLLLILPAVARAQESAGSPDLTPNGRGAYVSIAGAMDSYAMRSGALAAETARRPEVRELGETLGEEHRDGNERLRTAARALGLDAPEPAMMPMHWDMMRRLERVSASRFDRLFLRQQIRVHEMALALHRNYLVHGDAAVLREVAASMTPILERHLAQIRVLAD